METDDLDLRKHTTTEHRPQKLEARVLPLCHHGPIRMVGDGFITIIYHLLKRELDESALCQIGPRQIGPLKKSALDKSAP